MIKNTAGQYVSAQLVAVADGEDVTTGTTTVYVTGDGGTQASGGGTVTHEGNGCWSYAPTQAETNYDHVAYTFVNTAAVSVTVQRDPVTLADYKATVAGVQVDLVNAPNATAIAAIQNGLATPTNITAGTITTVTNLTNAPTNGDLTATMKASVTAAVPAAAAISSQVASDLQTAHGSGSWQTATGFSTHDAAAVVTALGTGSTLTAITSKTGNLPASPAATSDIPSVADILTTQMTESYAAAGVAPTLAQALFLVQQVLTEFGYTGTTNTVKKLDGATTAATFTLDDATDPTSQTRAT